ncbi:MAG: ribosome-associated translation inhibitor RaiA [Clostridia bacterium]|nr:ribosome-associated translation inhibitor RaiA [Clostridia bacterium]MBQ3553517.1 ribosome-associated translation inhibitor RaiA [Clostridia bacterium]
MKITMSGKQIELTPALKARIEERFERLDRYFHKETEATVTLSVQREKQVVEATVQSGGLLVRVEEATDDMYVSIDTAVDVLERQLRKHKTRIEKKLKKDTFDAAALASIPFPENIEEETEFKIARTKRFTVKPMSVEEAILQMELLGHQFFVFTNAETGDSNVVYKRKQNTYGLIELE